ncbi:PPE family protein [Mycolicibacter sp. MYC123]|uniref:PPE family protein n=1 Tax=[Mycobacterium] zoologicum TaxID=2872311 RepID=A0ABU5YL62_9MYCO|nr:PPE family protein [Mycolicibacter sp. MYC123]MEB3050780.1 PPE family protein [Mycolicibacter sp. MYC123]
MDFGALPPEINSGRMYAGAGAAPMMAAAAAWNSLGAELSTTATSYQSAIAALTGEEWQGPASASMAAAVTPYVNWLNTTAAAAEYAATQAMASAAAFEATFAMMVPPPAIAANRAQLAALVASNILGVNTAAIAATEALYAEMWAQDAIAMYGYAASSASAGTLQPLSSPNPITNPVGTAGQAAAVGQATTGSTQSGLNQLVSGLPNALQTMSSPLSAAASPTQAGDFLSNFINSTQNIGIWNAIQTYSTYGVTAGSWHLFAGIASAIAIANPGVGGAAGVMLMDSVDAAPGGAAVTGPAPAGRAPVLAGMAQAAPVGGLSVPSTWPGALPGETGTAPLITSEWIPGSVEEGQSVSAVPAGIGAAGAAAGRSGRGLGDPRYGFKPTVMVRPVVAG